MQARSTGKFGESFKVRILPLQISYLSDTWQAIWVINHRNKGLVQGTSNCKYTDECHHSDYGRRLVVTRYTRMVLTLEILPSETRTLLTSLHLNPTV